MRDTRCVRSERGHRLAPEYGRSSPKFVTLDEHIADTAGIECRTDEGVIDETPKAYKPIEAVMAAQADLVEIVQTLKQVVCVKG